MLFFYQNNFLYLICLYHFKFCFHLYKITPARYYIRYIFSIYEFLILASFFHFLCNYIEFFILIKNQSSDNRQKKYCKNLEARLKFIRWSCNVPMKGLYKFEEILLKEDTLENLWLAFYFNKQDTLLTAQITKEVCPEKLYLAFYFK